jgi:hypothetical protein
MGSFAWVNRSGKKHLKTAIFDLCERVICGELKFVLFAPKLIIKIIHD